MDQVHVEAPVGTTVGTPLERAFASDFAILLNYVARLTDRIDEAGGITCETFREIAARRDSPNAVTIERLLATAYPEQPLGRPIAGTPASVRSFSARCPEIGATV